MTNQPDEAELLAVIAASGVIDAEWYLRRNPDVAEAGAEPLLHYVRQGWREGRDPGPHFSTSWYLDTNPQVAASQVHPLYEHLTDGWRRGARPNPAFDVAAYDRSHPELRAAGIPPVVHYAMTHRSGRNKGRTGRRPSASGPPGDTKEPAPAPPRSTPLRTVAYYLPQFHPIPENDAWWGEGFTEWTNVRRGISRFPGHEQPHVPGDLGYYDLRSPDVLARQVEMARLHGVTAFCFYVYWFKGRSLLEEPLKRFLRDPSLDIELALCWANESWTRAWDGKADDVLIQQEHSAEDDIAFLEHYAPYLRDSRYLRVNGRAVLSVYRPELLPDAAATALRWRRWARDNGVGELHLVAVQSFSIHDSEVLGFDAVTEFPPNDGHLPDVTSRVAPGHGGRVFDWTALLDDENRHPHHGPTHRAVCVSWDNEARRPGKGGTLAGATPDLFEAWLLRVGSETIHAFPDDDERLVFINAWNEWAEGCHLEPDARHGYAWLHAVRRVQENLAVSGRGAGGTGRVLVVVHDGHRHGAQMLAVNLVHELVNLGLEVAVLSLADGDLLDDITSVAELHLVVDRDAETVAKLTEDLARRGFQTAICNSVVSATLVPALQAAGMHTTVLVHEMPELIRRRGLAHEVALAGSHADRVVLPSIQAHRVFEAAFGTIETEVLVLPQGLYRRNVLRAPIASADRAAARLRLGLPVHGTVVLGLGYGDLRKGFDRFVAIAETDTYDRQFVWVGALDVVDSEIAAAVERAGALPNVRLVGFTDDVTSYLQASDVFALTSREDPFPSVVLEAAGAGLRTVAFTGSTAMEDTLLGLGGVLVAPGAMNEYSAALRTVSQDAFERDLVRGRVQTAFNFRRYVMNLLHGTPAAIPRVSVVLPNYNYAEYIGARISNVLDQTLPVYEMVVLDDASDDGSVAVIRKALVDCDVPWSLTVSERNSGAVVGQWAAGTQAATGDIVWIAEADDVADKELLATLAASMTAEGVVLAYCQSRQINAYGDEIAPNYFAYLAMVETRDWRAPYVADGLSEIADCLAIMNTIPSVSATLIRRQVLVDVLANLAESLERHPSTGDWVVYLGLLSQGSIAYDPRILSSHRRHAKSVIGTVAANDHVAEIAAVQALANRILAKGDRRDSRQDGYLQSVSAHLSTTPPPNTTRREDRV
jgi:hypothetical protein